MVGGMKISDETREIDRLIAVVCASFYPGSHGELLRNSRLTSGVPIFTFEKASLGGWM